MGYHADLANKRRVEAAVQRQLDCEQQRRCEEAKSLLAESLRHMVAVPVEDAKWPTLTIGYGTAKLLPYKAWTRPFAKRRKPEAFPCGNILEMWHGTHAHSIKSIVTSGMRTGAAGCLFGSGIYLTRDIDKASNYGRQYIHDWNTEDYTQTLLRCAVSVGNYVDATAHARCLLNSTTVGIGKEWNSVWAPAYKPIDGVWTGALRGEEWVVYSGSQVEVLDIFVWHRGSKKFTLDRPEVPKPLPVTRHSRTAALLWRRSANLKGGRREVLLRHHCCVKDGNPCTYAEVERGTLKLESRCDWPGEKQNKKIINRDLVGLSLLRPLCPHFTPKEK